jgi:hypothetical protein
MNRIETNRLKRSLLEAVITTSVLTLAVPCALAQTSDWNGGTGNWNVAGNWTPTGVPNSSTTDVVITGTSGTPSSVTLNSFSSQIQNLSLDSYSTLALTNYYGVSVEGPSITNAGQINVGDSTYGGFLYIAASATVSGGGTLSLNNNYDTMSGATGSTLVNQSTSLHRSTVR